MVIDGGVDVVEPDPASSDLFAAAVGAPLTTVRDAAEFFHVDVDQLTQSLAFVAGRRSPGGADERRGDGVQPRQRWNIVSVQDA